MWPSADLVPISRVRILPRANRALRLRACVDGYHAWTWRRGHSPRSLCGHVLILNEQMLEYLVTGCWAYGVSDTVLLGESLHFVKAVAEPVRYGQTSRPYLAVRAKISRKDWQIPKESQHVVLRDGKWAVRRTGAKKARKRFDTQKEAIEAGREIARRQRTELYIHGEAA